MKEHSKKLLVIFLLSLVAILAGGYRFYAYQERALLAARFEQLQETAALKTGEIEKWRAVQLRDAAAFAEFLPGNLEDRREGARLLSYLKINKGYRDLLLVGAGGMTALLQTPEALPLTDGEKALAKEALAFGGPLLGEITQDAKGAPYIHLAAPSKLKTADGVVSAALLIRIDPANFLFPLIQSWPTQSTTAETLLVKREGDQVVYLNELRHQKGTVLKLKIPLSRDDLPAVRAVKGEQGIFQGVDYRGRKVVSAIAPVKGSPWFMVAKVDEEELLADLKNSALLTALLFGAVALLCLAAGRLVLENSDKRQYMELFNAERAQREAELRYQVILMSIGDGVVTTDREGRVKLLNPVAETLTGYSLSEVRGRPLTEVFKIINEETRAPAKNPVDEVMAKGVIVGLANHTLLISKNGIERPIADSAAPVWDDEGKLDGVVLVFRDQSEEHHFQKQVIESEERYRSLFNGMLDGYALHEMIFDQRGNPADYRFLSVNPAFLEFTGTRSSQVIGRRVLELMPNLEKKWFERYGRVVKTGEPVKFEEFDSALNKYFEVYAYRPAEGQFVTVVRDVTSRREVEQALEKRLSALERPLSESENLSFGDLFDLEEIQKLQDEFAQGAGVASLITDVNGNPITKPSNFCRLCSEIIRPSEKGAFNCAKSDAMLGAPSPDGPRVAPCLSGGLMDAGASIIVGGRHIANWLIGQVRDGDKTDADIRAYAREIGVDEEEAATAYEAVRVMPGEQFFKLAQTLHTMAAQLSRLAYQNLQQARFIAEEKRGAKEREQLQDKLLQSQKIESVGRLAGGVAHDFNNMLGVIIGHAEMAMLQIEETDPTYEDLQEIHSAAKRSAEITRQLLAFARKQTAAPRILDLNESVSKSLKMVRRLIGEDVEVFWVPGVGLWKVRIDPVQVDQLLANLATNARDAIKGSGKLTIETSNVRIDHEYCLTHPEFQEGDYAMLTVSDSGKGIEKSELSQIFEPFFTTKPVGEGTGLGLSTVYGIVKQNGGFINVYSEPDRGATFRIYLPRHLSDVAEMTGEQKPSAKFGDERVLLVEDEVAILNLARRILTTLGYQVVAAPTPEAALRAVDGVEEPFDLLLTDVVMPGMNGKELAAKLTAMNPAMKVLYMSGYTANVIVHKGVLDEGLNYIAKPFSVQELGSRVRDVLDS